MSERIKTGVGGPSTSVKKGKMSFMGKIIRANLLHDFAHLLRSHGLYPVIADKCMNFAPVFLMMHQNIINSKSSMTAQMTNMLKNQLGGKVPTFEIVR